MGRNDFFAAMFAFPERVTYNSVQDYSGGRYVTNDGRLLRDYVQQGSQAAFSALVTRHLNFVYSVSLRETGDSALAEDVTQVVFLILAKKAPSMHPEPSLSGWLFQTARFAAKNARRRERHRQEGEARALEQTPASGQNEEALWDQVRPALNDALASLGAKDREAVLLRFADGLSFPELGAALGTSEDAARMRLNRATERLRQFFAKEGVTLSAVVLAGLLADHVVQAAPDACATHIMTNLGVDGAISQPIYSQLKGALHAMAITKRYAAVAALLMIGAAGIVFNTVKHASAQVLSEKQEASDKGTISDPLSPNKAVRDAAQQRRIERAKLLRDHWQPWAENHRDLLRQMLDAKPADGETVSSVYEAIPELPGAAYISHNDLHTAGALFTWNAIGKHSVHTSTWFNNRMQGDFRKYHDFRLSESANTGRFHVVLWASGRITVMESRDRFAGHGQPIETYDEVQKVISPRYAFL
jgi:RNA polymerase sigma factor (sigma-70 family)